MFEFLSDFDERIENIGVFYPILKLQGAQKYPEYDVFSLGFSVLVYILDMMLKGKEGCSTKEIALFLEQLVEFNYGDKLSHVEGEELCYYVLDLLRNGGRPFELVYRNPREKVKKRIKVNLIEISSYRPKELLYYRLSTQGLDLMFKTREIYSELRITINQIYLKQQIEKGVFHEAIRTVDDLSLQVKDLKVRMKSFLERVFKNVVDVGIEGYKNLYNEAFEQIEREHQVFNDIKNLLEDLYKNLQSIDPNRITEKDRKDLEYVISLSKKLDNVINEHGELLAERIDLGQKYFEAMEDQFASGFRTKIDFEREIVDEIIKRDCRFTKVVEILSPLFTLKKYKSFNIHKVFEEQRMEKEDEDPNDTVVIDFDKEASAVENRERELLEQRKNNYEQYMELLIDFLKKRNTASLSQILRSLDSERYYHTINSFDFYTFLVNLHQMKKIEFDVKKDEDSLNSDNGDTLNLKSMFLKVVDKFSNTGVFNRLCILGSDEVIDLENGFKVTDYVFELG